MSVFWGASSAPFGHVEGAFARAARARGGYG